MKKLLISLFTLFLLTGCMKVDSVISFSEGMMTTSVDLYVSEEVVELDEQISAIVQGRKFSQLTPEVRGKICELFAGDKGFSPGDEEVTSKAKGIDGDGRLVCEAKGKPQSLTSEKLPYKVSHDAKNGVYTITGNSGDFLGNDETLDPKQLKEMGVEIFVAFLFPGELRSYNLGGKEELPSGVSLVNGKGIRFDLLEADPSSYTLVGSETVTAPAKKSIALSVGIIAISVLALSFGFVLWSRRRMPSPTSPMRF